nr:hypothetical protein [Tanacetum cinerariifolium]
MPNTRSRASMTHEEVEELIARRVAEEIEAREVARNLEALNENEEEHEGENGGNENGGNGGNENGGIRGNGNGDNGGNGNEGNGNHGMNYGGFMSMARECTFQDFLRCKPHAVSGTEGVLMDKKLKGYAERSAENKRRMESNPRDNHNGENGNGGNGNERNGNHGMNYGGFMRMARECTFQDFLKCKPHAFSGTEGVVGLTRWFEKMETVFNISNCPPKTIGVDTAYALKWAELMKLMTEVYYPRNDVQKMETKLWNLTGYAARSAENKKRMESNPRDNYGHKPPFKRQRTTGQNVAIAYTTGNNERKGDCKVTVNPNTQGAAVGNQQGVVCYECGRPGHFRKDCPKLRNQNHGN